MRSRHALTKSPTTGQLPLPIPHTWGGRRPGAGRKPGPRPWVPRVPRPAHAARHPVHVTLRATRGLGSLRARSVFPSIRAALGAASKATFRLVHFSVQGDHLHLLVEAHDRQALSRGVQGLAIRTARAVNRALHRNGPVWGDRYHARPLKTPREVRHALVYVLLNWRKHRPGARGEDPCSSGYWFDGWQRVRFLVLARTGPLRTEPPPVAAPHTWLLAHGWRRHGLLRLEERPGGAGARGCP